MIKKILVFIFLVNCSFFAWADYLIDKKPKNFVYLKDVDPTILQDMRYAEYHNFIGCPIPGYKAPVCILTRKAAEQLKKIQHEVRAFGYSLKVYECYRPQQAVNFFIEWSKNVNEQNMKAEFYPQINKKDVFKLGYVASKSSHTRGSTVDLTLVKLPVKPSSVYHHNAPLVACYAPYGERFKDNSIDMGTGYDCFSFLSHPDNTQIPLKPYLNRMFLNYWMNRYGFFPSETEWWHFTLRKEPYPNTYFDFPVS